MKTSLLVKFTFGILSASMILHACGKEDLYTQVVPEMIKVVSGADIAFKAKGGEGDIVVNAVEGGTLEVSTEQSSWCHLSVDGNTIHVSTDVHNGLESRYAKIKMKSGNASGVTVVHQYGIIVKEFNPVDTGFKNGENEVAFYYDANESLIEARTDADWITIIVEPDYLRLKVSENTEGTYREGKIEWNIGQMTGSFFLSQFDLADAGLLGEWSWTSQYATGSTQWPMDAKIEATDDGGYLLSMERTTSALEFKFQHAVEVSRNRLMIPLGQSSGTYVTKKASYIVFPIFASGTAAVGYNDKTVVNEGYLPLIISKKDDGSWIMETDTSDPNVQQLVFRFELWENEQHDGNSSSRISLKNIQMVKK